jgi:hypothetical protein
LVELVALPDAIKLHRIDGVEVHIVKADIEEWFLSDDKRGTQVNKIDGTWRIVRETPAEIEELMK